VLDVEEDVDFSCFPSFLFVALLLVAARRCCVVIVVVVGAVLS
jgi:hypothetical protein